MLESLFYKHKALIIGALIGLIFGPIGLAIGAILGAMIDRNRPMASSRTANRAFFEACFYYLGFLAKADGHVSQNEIDYARRVMRQLHLSPTETQEAMAFFRKGKTKDFDENTVLSNLRSQFASRPRILAQFINILVRMTYINGYSDDMLKTKLQHIARSIGIGPLNFAYYDLMFGWQSHFEQARGQFNQQQGHYYQGAFGGQQPYKTSLSDAYRILGVSKDSNKNDVKRAYRRLMSKYHPDKLMSKGLSEKDMQEATEKAQKIKSAYEQICQAHGF